jgi:hypothetical protein
MTDPREQRTDESKDSQTIHIEMPDKTFKGMCGMMSGFWRADAADSGCCKPRSGMCCPKPEEGNTFKFTVLVKPKE